MSDILIKKKTVYNMFIIMKVINNRIGLDMLYQIKYVTSCSVWRSKVETYIQVISLFICNNYCINNFANYIALNDSLYNTI